MKNDTSVWYLNAPDLNPYICYKPCRFGQWDDDETDAADPRCARCDDSCNGCNSVPEAKGGTNQDCDACARGYYNKTDVEPNICSPCHASCFECSSGLNSACTVCNTGYYLDIAIEGTDNTGTTCYATCPDG